MAFHGPDKYERQVGVQREESRSEVENEKGTWKEQQTVQHGKALCVEWG